MRQYLLGGLVLVSCAVDQPNLSSTAGESFEEFKASVPHESGTGYYVVDWDRVLKNDAELFDFWGQLQQEELAVYNINGTDIKWTDTQKLDLTYCVGTTFGARQQQVIDAMVLATAQGWEKFANVHFVHVASEDANCTTANANVLFDVNQVTGQQYLARSFFPNDARANRELLVDVNSFDPAQTNNIPLQNILAHECGHILGFRHEHIRPEAGNVCPEDNNFRGLTPYDSASVMHYPQCNGTSATLAFTTMDQQGAAMLYGAPVANMAPMTQVTAPLDGAQVPATFEVDASVVDTDLTNATLFIDGSAYGAPLTTAPFTFQVTNLALGAHELKIVGVDSAAQMGTTVIHVTVVNGSGGGGGGGGGDTPENDVSGGCSTGGASGGLLLLGLIGLVIRRRR
jgi:MYXO-CTERM domain-containing protein